MAFAHAGSTAATSEEMEMFNNSRINEFSSGAVPTLMQRINPFGGIFKSEEKKPPKGFEKFFKKKEDREKETSAAAKGKWNI